MDKRWTIITIVGSIIVFMLGVGLYLFLMRPNDATPNPTPATAHPTASTSLASDALRVLRACRSGDPDLCLDRVAAALGDRNMQYNEGSGKGGGEYRGGMQPTPSRRFNTPQIPIINVDPADQGGDPV